ncbi:nucleotidyltransferase family protein [Eggerthella sinensis]|uniref:nucleotidyltransferase family protein n=1 Tax=Eggerthella sinensis TaxID=242230 RepID=UPI00266BF8BE|nr:nucleotidyltransferase domain-containing protein [Eggerthella sinensis]
MVETKIYTIDELTGMLKPIMARHNAQKAVVFGSYARGTATPQSDLDVLVYGGEGFRGRSIFAIAEELHEASGKRVDVYERSELSDASPLLEAIEAEGVTI